MSVLAIIPARSGSKGIPNKNFRRLGVFPDDAPPFLRAVSVAYEAGCDDVVLSTDHPPDFACLPIPRYIRRPPELAQDDTPMIAVVQHVLAQIPGPPDQKIVLLQPTQPLREPKHITQALELLDRHPSGTVVSVVPTESIDKCLTRVGWELLPCGNGVERRQDAVPTLKRDGTVYAWRRRGPFMAHPWIALDIPPSETCPLDTPEDWAEAERRLKEREG